MTGLVIGSMAPDFEYFLRMGLQGHFGHSLAGIFWFDLPLGIALAFLYHQVVRNRLIDNLPSVFRSRLSLSRQFQWLPYFKKNWYIVAICMVAGTATHIFWDSFTHADGFFALRIPLLQQTFPLFGHPIPLYRIMQHASTLAGGFVLLYWFFHLPADSAVTSRSALRYWVVLVFIALLILVVRLSFAEAPIRVELVIVSGISAGMAGMVISSLVHRP
jgi:hypothetical protein